MRMREIIDMVEGATSGGVKNIALRKLHAEPDDMMSVSPSQVEYYKMMWREDPDSVPPIKVAPMELHPILNSGAWKRGERHYKIKDGHHRFIAAKEMGRTTIPSEVVAADWAPSTRDV